MKRLMLISLLVACCGTVLAATPGMKRFSTHMYFTEHAQLRHQAEQGDAQSQFDLAWLYYIPDEELRLNGVPHSYNMAARWYRKAAEQGHTLAQFNMGVMYLKGQGVSRNGTDAYTWFSLAADNGHSESQRILPILGNVIGTDAVAVAENQKELLTRHPVRK